MFIRRSTIGRPTAIWSRDILSVLEITVADAAVGGASVRATV
jgi:hypothetical protein